MEELQMHQENKYALVRVMDALAFGPEGSRAFGACGGRLPDVSVEIESERGVDGLVVVYRGTHAAAAAGARVPLRAVRVVRAGARARVGADGGEGQVGRHQRGQRRSEPAGPGAKVHGRGDDEHA